MVDNIINFTFLNEKEIFGENELENLKRKFLNIEPTKHYKQLNVLKEYGNKIAVPDFAMLFGVDYSDDYHFFAGENLKYHSGSYCTKTTFEDFDDSGVYAVSQKGQRYREPDEYYLNKVTRPVCKYDSILLTTPDITMKKINNIYEFEYGEYPHNVVTIKEQKYLEYLYNKKSLKITGKKYLTEKIEDWCKNRLFGSEQEHIEYYYKDRKFVRIKPMLPKYEKIILSNGIMYDNNDAVWIEVKPLKWLYDLDTDLAITKHGIYFGTNFNRIEKFMNKYFSNGINPSIMYQENTIDIDKKKTENNIKLSKSFIY